MSTSSAVKDAQIYCCEAVIIITVVGYDYVLTLSREIESIWCRPWTRVSALFIVVRYVGLSWAIILALIGTAFIPGSVKTYVFYIMSGSGTAMLVVGDWGYMLFLAAADLVMILRVYAMWDQSRIILSILLLLYIPQVVLSAVWEGVYNYPNRTISVTVVQVLRYSYCSYSSSPTTPSATYRAIPRFILGAALLILAAVPTVRQSIDMHKLTRRWRANRSMKLLLREGAVYFIVNLLFNIVNAVQLPVVDLMMFLNVLGYSLSCAIVPRFIIDIRELYDRDLQNRWQGMDTGFGVLVDTTREEDQVLVIGADESEAVPLGLLGNSGPEI